MASSNPALATGAFTCPSRQNGTKIDASPIDHFIGSSLEANVSHYSSPGVASGQENTSYSDRGSFRNTPNNRFGSTSQSKSRSQSQTSTFSRAYAATLSKLGLRHGTKDNKLEDKLISALSGGRSVKIGRAIKRKPLLDFQPPHCQQRQFDDGFVVHMIGGITPPRIKRSNEMKEGASSEASEDSVKESPPHKIGINIRPDSFFGPAIQLPDWDVGDGGSTSGDRASIRSVLLSAYGDTTSSSVQKDSETSVISLGLQLQRTLLPSLSLIPTDIFDTSLDLNGAVISSTPPLRSSLESPVLGTSAFAVDTPYISPLLSPLTPDLTPTPTPVDSIIDGPSPPDVSGARELHAITGVDASIETAENLSADTGVQLKDLSSNIEKISLVSMDSLSAIRSSESLEHRGSRWDDLDQPTAASSFNIPSSIELTQLVASISSTSLLGPLTQADFDASFEQIFRVSYSGGLDPVLAATTHLGRYMALRKMHVGIPGVNVGNERNSRTGGGSRVYPYQIPELRIVPPSSP